MPAPAQTEMQKWIATLDARWQTVDGVRNDGPRTASVFYVVTKANLGPKPERKTQGK